jgi:hypothetical protein
MSASAACEQAGAVDSLQCIHQVGLKMIHDKSNLSLELNVNDFFNL